MVLTPKSENEDDLLKEIEALKLELGPYTNLESLLRDKSLNQQYKILLTLCKVERRSAEMELHSHVSTKH